MISPIEYIRRRVLMKSIAKKYNIKVYKDGTEGTFSYNSGTLTPLRIVVDTMHEDFYSILFHEVGHLLDLRIHKLRCSRASLDLRNGVWDTKGTPYSTEVSPVSHLRGKITGFWGSRGSCEVLLRSELVASKTAIRVGKITKFKINSDFLLKAFYSYSNLVYSYSTENKIVAADLDYHAVNYLK